MKSLQDCLDLLKKAEKDISVIKSFYETLSVNQQLDKLQEKVNLPNAWQDPSFIEINKKLRGLSEKKDSFEAITKDYDQIKELISIFENSADASEQNALCEEIQTFCKKVGRTKIEFLLGQKFDANNCFLSINPGAGGTESQDWADMLFRMYQRFAEKQKFSVSILDYQAANEAGIKNVMMLVKGKNAYGLLKSETGIHRLVRISPFDANKRRHTSFAAVAVSPEVEEGAIEIKANDLRIDTYRSGGAGGQHVNTTDSAVRITHIPTGIVAQCQNERSQHQNKQQALKVLYSKIIEHEEQKKRDLLNATAKDKIEWGSQIRSYVLHPYKMVKDHRTEEESFQPDMVLDGELEAFIESYLVKQTKL